jgi:hypothetical protein
VISYGIYIGSVDGWWVNGSGKAKRQTLGASAKDFFRFGKGWSLL